MKVEEIKSGHEGDRFIEEYIASCDQCGIHYWCLSDRPSGDGDHTESNDFCSPVCEQAHIEKKPAPDLLYGVIFDIEDNDGGGKVDYLTKAYDEDHALGKAWLLYCMEHFNQEMEPAIAYEEEFGDRFTPVLIGHLPFQIDGHEPPTPQSDPPPTTLNTLERMHSHCMEMESDLSELRLLGTDDIDLDDLTGEVESLTAQIQSIIDDNTTEDNH